MKDKGRTSIWGARRSRGLPAEIILGEAERDIHWLQERKPTRQKSLQELKATFVRPARSYFALAAFTRRTSLPDNERQLGLERLFGMRARLEKALIEELRVNLKCCEVMKHASGEAFFGRSKKQGVSVRYTLTTCIPTARCGGLCYAHDGRDRAFDQVFRGALNYFLGHEYENGTTRRRKEILNMLSWAVDKGVAAALLDQIEAVSLGYQRLPRIRFSHVGEMAATPAFTNALAREVKKRDESVQCVIYTRHPRAGLLDPSLLVVNFTLEGLADPRKRFLPAHARVVNSSWNGDINPEADVNFLEHHVQRIAVSKGSGSICPVTANHATTPTCDLARCQKCFLPNR